MNRRVFHCSVVSLLAVTMLPVRAEGADRPLTVTIQGRPISRSAPVAFLRDDVAYASATELVRAYDGLETDTNGLTSITIGSHQAAFAVYKAAAIVDGTSIAMGAPALVVDGALYVPLEFFVTHVAGGTVHVSGTTADIRLAADPSTRPH